MRPAKKQHPKGMALILLVALITISGILTASAFWFISNEARYAQLRIDSVKAYDMAYAGVMRACYDWVDDSATEANRRYAGLNTTLAGTILGYKTGVPANFAYFSFDLSDDTVWTNTTGSTSGTLLRLREFRIRNIHTNAAPANIIVTGAKVSWTPAGSELLTDIRLNNLSVMPSGGPVASGTELTLGNTDTNRTRTSGAFWGNNSTYLQWTGAPPDPVKVTVVWTFKDNSVPAVTDSKTHEIIFWDGCKATTDCDGFGTPLGRPALRTFTITSTGSVNQTTGGYFKVLKTVRATVSGTPPGRRVEIIDWRESDNALI